MDPRRLPDAFELWMAAQAGVVRVTSYGAPGDGFRRCVDEITTDEGGDVTISRQLDSLVAVSGIVIEATFAGGERPAPAIP